MRSPILSRKSDAVTVQELANDDDATTKVVFTRLITRVEEQPGSSSHASSLSTSSEEEDAVVPEKVPESSEERVVEVVRTEVEERPKLNGIMRRPEGKGTFIFFLDFFHCFLAILMLFFPYVRNNSGVEARSESLARVL